MEVLENQRCVLDSLSVNTMQSFSTPDLCDEHSDSIQVAEPIFSHFGLRQQFAGQVATVKCFEDNSLVAETVAMPGSGRVLVVDGIATMQIGILAIASVPRKTEKLGEGQSNVSVSFAGVTINPGDHIYADRSNGRCCCGSKACVMRARVCRIRI